MRITNETHEPLRIKFPAEESEGGENFFILEPGESDDVPDMAGELTIEHSPEPHLVSQMEISEN